MSLLQTTYDDSDSENDEEYLPPADDPQNSSDDEGAAGQRNAKRAKASPPPANEEEKAAKKRERDALWASFQASVAGPANASPSAPPTMVKIEKRFRFAGEEVIEVAEVPQNSEDARKWPRWYPPTAETPTSTEPAVATTIPSASTATNDVISMPQPLTSTPTLIVDDTPTSSATSPSIPPPTRPGPRKKSKMALAMAAIVLPPSSGSPIPSSSSFSASSLIHTPRPRGRPRKISTLDKSAMDWRAHVETASSSTPMASSPSTPMASSPGIGAPTITSTALSLREELEANRRNGGYLDKVAFLQRVDGRKEEALEAGKGTKRRRG